MGPEWTGEDRTVDVDGEADGGSVTVRVGEFPGEILGVAVVKGDKLVDVDKWSALPVKGAVGIAEVKASAAGLTGKVTLRLRCAA